MTTVAWPRVVRASQSTRITPRLPHRPSEQDLPPSSHTIHFSGPARICSTGIQSGSQRQIGHDQENQRKEGDDQRVAARRGWARRAAAGEGRAAPAADEREDSQPRKRGQRVPSRHQRHPHGAALEDDLIEDAIGEIQCKAHVSAAARSGANPRMCRQSTAVAPSSAIMLGYSDRALHACHSTGGYYRRRPFAADVTERMMLR